jgi:hypothetical protein
MVLRTTGANWLTMMMRAERARRGEAIPHTDWLLYGPTDSDAVEDERGVVARLLAAE